MFSNDSLVGRAGRWPRLCSRVARGQWRVPAGPAPFGYSLDPLSGTLTGPRGVPAEGISCWRRQTGFRSSSSSVIRCFCRQNGLWAAATFRRPGGNFSICGRPPPCKVFCSALIKSARSNETPGFHALGDKPRTQAALRAVSGAALSGRNPSRGSVTGRSGLQM